MQYTDGKLLQVQHPLKAKDAFDLVVRNSKRKKKLYGS